MADENTPPAADVFEVSVFGSGVGECVVVHMGAGDWMVVDSCLEPLSGEPAALAYFRRIDVDVSRQVRLIVATHWHDDHIQGLADVVALCENSPFVTSTALRSEHLAAMIGLEPRCMVRSSSGLRQIARIKAILDARSESIPTLASADRILWTRHGEPAAQVQALSPSDADTLEALKTLAESFPQAGEEIRCLREIAPNAGSVVLWVTCGEFDVLLGGDLEVVPGNDRRGWGPILSSKNRIGFPRRAIFFKIPHHGSETAFDYAVWKDLLAEEPCAAVTRFSRSDLPRPEMKKKFASLAGMAFLAGDEERHPVRISAAAVRRTLEEMGLAPTQPRGCGHIRVRFGPSSVLTVEVFGPARRICTAAA